MRYIIKGNNVPQIISDYRTLRQTAGQAVSYDDFPQTGPLNDILRAEQRSICCYCMQSINHFQGENEAGSHNEHLIPQRGLYGNAALQMDYNNIYACCNYTKGFPDDSSYCGWHKHDSLITDFISQNNCRNFFKYNSTGEILPNGIYETESEYLLHENTLPKNQKDALEAIKVLNLNQTVLKKRRADLINQIIPIIRNVSKQQAKMKIQIMTNKNPLPPFVEVNIYYLKQVR
jgi:uncharacterized protein (TIGR02646 family)